MPSMGWEEAFPPCLLCGQWCFFKFCVFASKVSFVAVVVQPRPLVGSCQLVSAIPRVNFKALVVRFVCRRLEVATNSVSGSVPYGLGLLTALTYVMVALHSLRCFLQGLPGTGSLLLFLVACWLCVVLHR
jgi:hypothetical protein